MSHLLEHLRNKLLAGALAAGPLVVVAWAEGRVWALGETAGPAREYSSPVNRTRSCRLWPSHKLK